MFTGIGLHIVGPGKPEICKANYCYSHEAELFLLWETLVFALKVFK